MCESGHAPLWCRMLVLENTRRHAGHSTFPSSTCGPLARATLGSCRRGPCETAHDTLSRYRFSATCARAETHLRRCKVIHECSAVKDLATNEKSFFRQPLSHPGSGGGGRGPRGQGEAGSVGSSSNAALELVIEGALAAWPARLRSASGRSSTLVNGAGSWPGRVGTLEKGKNAPTAAPSSAAAYDNRLVDITFASLRSRGPLGALRGRHSQAEQIPGPDARAKSHFLQSNSTCNRQESTSRTKEWLRSAFCLGRIGLSSPVPGPIACL